MYMLISLTFCILQVIEAGHFWAHYGTSETFNQLKNLQHSINAMNGSNLSVSVSLLRFHAFSISVKISNIVYQLP